MSRSISGILFVDSFIPTGVDGEYTFENAKYSNQSDTTGSGAYELQVGFVLHTQATDPNTFMVVPGVVSRYLITELLIIDAETVSGKVIWNMPTAVVDWPTNSSYCLVSQTTSNKNITLPAPDALYPELQPGFTESIIVNDISDIIDIPCPTGPGTGSSEIRIIERLVINVNAKKSFTLSHTPNNPQATVVSINGLIYLYGLDGDYFITSNILTWTENSIILETSDIMTISYTY